MQTSSIINHYQFPFIIIYICKNDSVAQLVEQLTLNQRVQGSSPCGVTNLQVKRNYGPAKSMFAGCFVFEIIQNKYSL